MTDLLKSEAFKDADAEGFNTKEGSINLEDFSKLCIDTIYQEYLTLFCDLLEQIYLKFNKLIVKLFFYL